MWRHIVAIVVVACCPDLLFIYLKCVRQVSGFLYQGQTYQDIEMQTERQRQREKMCVKKMKMQIQMEMQMQMKLWHRAALIKKKKTVKIITKKKKV